MRCCWEPPAALLGSLGWVWWGGVLAWLQLGGMHAPCLTACIQRLAPRALHLMLPLFPPPPPPPPPPPRAYFLRRMNVAPRVWCRVACPSCLALASELASTKRAPAK